MFFHLTLMFFVVYLRLNERNNGILSDELVNLDTTIPSHESDEEYDRMDQREN